MLLTKRQRELLPKHIPNADELIARDDLDGLLEALDDEFLYHGLDPTDEPTEYGFYIESLRDQIFAQDELPEGHLMRFVLEGKADLLCPLVGRIVDIWDCRHSAYSFEEGVFPTKLPPTTFILGNPKDKKICMNCPFHPHIME